jgi:hypothetical protein
MKLRHDPTRMIDLTRSLPSLQDSLTPRETQTEPGFLRDLIAALVLGTMAAYILLLALGYR